MDEIKPLLLLIFSSIGFSVIMRLFKEDTKNNIDYFLEVIKNKKYPEETFGPQCEKPSDCALNECWDFLPENNVFDLASGGNKSLQLFEEGIHAIRDIPEYFELNESTKNL